METAKKKREKRRRGQVIDLGSGSFKIRVPVGRDGTGKRKYHTETMHNTTPTKAENRCIKILSDVNSGDYFKPSRVTLKEFIEKEWLPQKAREGVREASSLKTYRLAANSYVIPALGHLPLAEVSPRSVQQLYNDMQDRGLRKATMKLAQAVVRMALRKAVAWRYLRRAIRRKESRCPPPRSRRARGTPSRATRRFDSSARRRPAPTTWTASSTCSRG